MAHRPLDVAEGFRLGSYTLVTQIGRGGFAPVWLAKELWGDVELRTVAIKLFRTDPNERNSASGPLSSQGRLRILEEARSLCRVEHPNIVRFYAVTTTRDESLLGLVMEHVQGTSLDRRIQDDGKLPVGDAVAVGSAVASALAAVHAVGLVHRDVKPANVIESRGVYKLIDFGIAASDRRSDRTPEPPPPADVMVIDDLPIALAGTEAPTATTDAMSSFTSTGTVGFIDPAAISAPATFASDLYSLGGTLFQCLTGSLPAAAAARLEGVGGLKGDVLDGRAKAPSLDLVLPGANKALVALVDSLLEPDPSKRPRSAESVSWELERIRREIAGRSRPLPPENIGPFRGLARFEEGDRDVYFGRAVEVAAAVEMMRSRGLVALIGPSGSGKSSLARAGVLPAILDGELGGWPKAWDAATCTPLARPNESIARALDKIVPDAHMLEPEVLVDRLKERVRADGRGVVILVDQLEELVTIANEEGRDYLARLLGIIGQTPIPGVRVIVAARRDLLDPLLALPELGRTLARGTLLVSPMSAATWGEVIDQALSAYGYSLEDEALRAELLLQLKNVADAMPLVQFALTQLWSERDRSAKKVTRAALNKVGGIAGALERHAEASIDLVKAVSKNASESPIDVARALLLEFTTPQGTRATKTIEELEIAAPSPLLSAVLDVLEENRLVIREPEGLTLAHEALLHWERLREWVDTARVDRELIAEIEQDARRWDRSDRDDTMLWKGQRALSAEELIERGARLSTLGKEFVQRALKAMADARLARDRGLRARVISVAAFVLVVIGAVFSGAYANNDHQRIAEIQKAQNDAHAALLRAKALNAMVGDHDAAELLFARSLQLANDPDTRMQLLSERLSGRTTVKRLFHSQSKVATGAILFKPDGSIAMTWDGSSDVHVWDLIIGREVETNLPHHVSLLPVFDSTWSSLALVTEDDVLHTYDVTHLAKPDLQGEVRVPSLQQVVIAGGPYADDARVVVYASDSLLSWDLHLKASEKHEHIATGVMGPDDDLSGLIIKPSSDSKQVELVSGDTVLDLNPTTLLPATTDRVELRKDSVVADLLVASSPDGRWRVGPDTEGVLRVAQMGGSDLSKGRVIDCAPAQAVAFSPQSNRLVCLKYDHSLEIWSVEQGTSAELAADSDSASSGAPSLQYSADGQQLLLSRGDAMVFDAAGTMTLASDDRAVGASSDFSKIAFVHTVGPKREISFRHGEQEVSTLAAQTYLGDGSAGKALSPAGRYFIGSDLKVNDLKDKAPKIYDELLTDMAFTADGRTLAIAGFASNRIVLLEQGETLSRILAGPAARVRSVGFGPSGQMLASGYEDGTVVVWRLRGGDPLRFHANDRAVVGVGVTSAGDIVTRGQDDKQVQLFNGVTGAPQKQLDAGSEVLAFAVSPRSELVAASSGTKVTLFSADAKQEISSDAPVVALAFSDDGVHLALGTDHGDVRIFDAQSLHEEARIHAVRGAVLGLAFQDDHIVLAGAPLGGSATEVPVDEARVHKRPAPRATDHVVSAATALDAPTSRLVSWAWLDKQSAPKPFEPDRTTKLFAVDPAQHQIAGSELDGDSASGYLLGKDQAVVARDLGQDFLADSLVFSADGRRVTGTASNGDFLVFGEAPSDDAHWWLDLRVVKSPKAAEGIARRMAFAPDARSFAAIDPEGEVRIYRVDLSGITALSRTLKASAKTLAYDSNLVATANDSGDVILWNVANGDRLAVLHGDDEDTKAARISLSPDHSSLSVLTPKGTLRRWNLADIRHVMTASPDVLFAEATEETGLILEGDNPVPRHSLDSARLPLLKGDVEAAMRRALDARLVSNGDPLTDVTLTRLFGPYANLEAVMRDHTAAVTAVAFNPDGSRWVSASQDGTARLSAGKQTLAVMEGQDSLGVAVFSPDDRFVLTGSERGDVTLWNAKTGELKRRLKGHGAPVLGVAFSSDHHLAVTSSATSVIVWDLDNEKPLVRSSGFAGTISSVAFEPNGRRLLRVATDSATIWDVDAMAASVARGVELKDPQKQVDAPKGERFLVGAWSPDNKSIALGLASGVLQTWDPSLSTPDRTMKLTMEQQIGETVTSLSYRADAQLLAASSDEAIVVVEAATKRVRFAFPFRHSRGWFAHDDMLVASRADEVRVFDTASGATLMELRPLKSVTGDVPAPAAMSGGSVLTGFASGEVLAWATPNASTRPIDRTLVSQSSTESFVSHTITSEGQTTEQQVVGIAPSPDGQRIAMIGQTVAEVWNIAEDTAQSLEIPSNATQEMLLRDVAYSPDGARIAISANDGSVSVYDAIKLVEDANHACETDDSVCTDEKAQPRKPLFVLHHKERVRHVCFSPDGKTLASVSKDEMVGLWNATTGAALHPLMAGHKSYIFDCEFDGKGARLATSASNGSVRVWDVATGTALPAPSGVAVNALYVDLSPDGESVAAAGDDRKVHVWDASTGLLRRDFDLDGFAGAMRFDPSGTKLAASTIEGSTKVWDVKTGAPKFSVAVRDGDSTSLEWSLDGQLLAIVFGGRGTQVVDGETGALLWYLADQQTDLRFMSRGRLATFSGTEVIVRPVLPFATPPAVQGGGSGQLLFALGVHPLTVSGSEATWRGADGVLSRFTSRIGLISTVASSQDSQRFAIATSGVIQGWSERGIEAPLRQPSTLPGASVWFAQFVDDATVVTSGWDQTVKIWDAATGTVRRSVDTTLPAYDGFLSPARDRIAIVSRARIQIRATSTGELTAVVDGLFRDQPSVEWSADGGRILAYDSTYIGMWDTASGAMIAMIDRPFYGVRLARFRADGRVVYQERSTGTVHVWDQTKIEAVVTLDLSREVTRGLDIDSKGLVVAVGSDKGVVRTFDALSGKLLKTIHTDAGKLRAVSFSIDSRLLAVVGDGGAQVIDMSTSRVGPTCGYGGSEIRWNLTGTRFVANDGTDLSQLCTSEGKIVRVFSGAAIAISPNGKHAVLQNGSETSMWTQSDKEDALPTSLTSAGKMGSFDPPVFWIGPTTMLDLSFTSVGPRTAMRFGRQLAVTDLDRATTLWQAEDLKCTGRHSATLSPDGKRLGVLACQTAKVFDVEDPKVEVVVGESGGKASGITLGRDHVAVATEGGINVSDGKQERFLPLPSREGADLERITFSADDRWIAGLMKGSYKFDPVARVIPSEVDVWEVETGKLVLRRFFPSESIKGLAFTDDARELLVAVGDRIAAIGLSLDVSPAMVARIVGLLPPAGVEAEPAVMWINRPTAGPAPSATAMPERPQTAANARGGVSTRGR